MLPISALQDLIDVCWQAAAVGLSIVGLSGLWLFMEGRLTPADRLPAPRTPRGGAWTRSEDGQACCAPCAATVAHEDGLPYPAPSPVPVRPGEPCLHCRSFYDPEGPNP
jgi:hypothetical protein